MSGLTAHHRLTGSLWVPRSMDLAVAVVATAAALIQLRHGIGPVTEPPAEISGSDIFLTAGSTLPLIAWRRSTVGVFVITAVFGTLLAATGQSIELNPGPAAALFLMATTRTNENRWAGRHTLITVALLTSHLLAAGLSRQQIPVSELLHTGLLWGAAWFAGDRHRLRREQLDELRDRADRIEREAVRERQLAVAEERARIARDLHDSAGHAITLIAVRAGAARLRHPTDPDRSLTALQTIEELARQTAAEIDQTVRSLRAPEGAEVEPAGGVASLDLLVSRHTRSGRPVTLRQSGEPKPLPPATDRAAYRITQEALTNAAKHGVGPADVLVAYGNDALELIVTNPVARDHQPTRNAGGHGLIGIRERADLVGGSLVTRRNADEFVLTVRLPIGDPPA
ncbi:signal transduction histidine kinase [Kribbella sp. VKM Ac-2527]|uniref:histidine kinase n=1 Tax=Kribbella caucasensis TaxID=2512215 RepID=A0A4R6KIF5_9ACTN|nr:sensor histidine kinase [Kribbella sp. VKM Ac-2527]TDO48463.1 signal transduction histidine kinase [Kribbella sp. VKM Ac-2527]